MKELPVYLQQVVAGMTGLWGGVGLFFVAFCDSSFLSLPEINDVLILYLCTRAKENAYYYALMATLGSTAGCSVLYWLGKWKGYSFLQRKYSQTKLQSALQIFQRYGSFAIIGPALMPPPFPFKIFVLSAGIFGLSFPRFVVAVVAGRAFRYFFEATLAIRYGDQAMVYVRDNYMQVAMVALAVVLGGLVAYLVAGQVRRRSRPPAERAAACTPTNNQRQ